MTHWIVTMNISWIPASVHQQFSQAQLGKSDISKVPFRPAVGCHWERWQRWPSPVSLSSRRTDRACPMLLWGKQNWSLLYTHLKFSFEPIFRVLWPKQVYKEAQGNVGKHQEWPSRNKEFRTWRTGAIPPDHRLPLECTRPLDWSPSVALRAVHGTNLKFLPLSFSLY